MRCIVCQKLILRTEKQPPVATDLGKIHFECYVPYIKFKQQIEEAYTANQ